MYPPEMDELAYKTNRQRIYTQPATKLNLIN
jgi:hypothetical protein